MNKVLLNKMLNTISRKDYSENELKVKYKRLEIYEMNEIVEVINYLKEHNFVNDERYCENYIRIGISKKWGLNKIKQKLSFDKKINKKIIDEKISNVEVDEKESIVKIIQSKYSKLDLQDPKQKAKVYRSLVSKGFNSSDISKALKLEIDNDY